jgi:hypothetical protein
VECHTDARDQPIASLDEGLLVQERDASHNVRKHSWYYVFVLCNRRCARAYRLRNMIAYMLGAGEWQANLQKSRQNTACVVPIMEATPALPPGTEGLRLKASRRECRGCDPDSNQETEAVLFPSWCSPAWGSESVILGACSSCTTWLLTRRLRSSSLLSGLLLSATAFGSFFTRWAFALCALECTRRP